jgi:uncharacterized membrane protein YfcA
MEYFIIGGVSFLTAILTFFSGFGVGTILTPVFIIFFPIEIAIAMTAIVHFSNNLFKFALTYKDIDKAVLLRFGLPAIPFAVLGAWILVSISKTNVLLSDFTIFSFECEIYLIQLIVGVLMLFFAIAELFPGFKKESIKNKHLIAGGAISGFFGGLTGHQGALRTMFLIKSGLNKNSFIATGIAIAMVVDVSRLSVYFGKVQKINIQDNLGIIITATLCAFAGAFLGKKLLQKITINTIQYLVSVIIGIVSILLIFGII